ncbi:MAG: HVO_0476 family zinc finger protein [Thermoplasmata archaeon]
MLKVPKTIEYFCENCKEETKHRVIKGKITEGKKLRFKGVIKCSVCGATREVEIAEEKPVIVNVNISFGETTKTEKVEFEPDEEIVAGETLVVLGRRAKVTKVELEDRSVKRAEARKVKRIWVKDVEKVRVKLAVNERNITKSYAFLAEPDEEFCVGEILDTEDGEVVITSIKTSSKLVKRENEPVYADEIKRIFCRRVT